LGLGRGGERYCDSEQNGGGDGNARWLNHDDLERLGHRDWDEVLSLHFR
jgi:hypothetical protein